MKIDHSSPSHNSARSRYFAAIQLAALLFACGASQAQIATDGSLGAQVQLSGPNYVIDPALGQQRGANLFHSFTTFNIGTAESARFNSAAGTSNIIARVTGGFGSEINGALTANANLFLLNPQGILVGANAAINVTGSLHLSTADYIRFGNGTKFYVNLSATSVLSTTAPSAFGFLDAAVAPIRMVGTTLNLSDGQTLSLIGGDVTLENANVAVPGGRINIASVAGSGEVVLGSGSLDATSIVGRGDVRLDNVAINGPGMEGASVYVRSGQFVIENASSITGIATQASSAHAIDVEADVMQLKNSRIEYGSSSVAAGASITTADIRVTNFSASDASVLSIAGGGDVSIAGAQVNVDSGSSVGTGTTVGGRAGNLTITANTININAGTLTTIAGNGDAGSIGINAADTINILSGATVASTTSGAGTGGSIAINAKNLVIDGSQSTRDTGVSAGSLSAADNAGDAGKITIDVGSLQVRAGFISSITNGPGRGGDINVIADTIVMDQSAAVTTETGVLGSQGNPSAFGRGGAIMLDAATLQMSSGARISASTLANGEGGSITINAAQLQIDSAGAALTTGITANSGSLGASASGNGGNLFLKVNDLQVKNQGQIASNAYGSGLAGRIELLSNSISIDSGGVISASSFGQNADAGSANEITIQAQQLNINDFGQITNSTTGAGDAGRLAITADQIHIANGGLLQSSSLSQSGHAGAVGDIAVDTQSLTMSGGSIHARSFGFAAPGRIDIEASMVTLDEGAVISATSAAAGDAGFISIRAVDTLRLNNSSRITTEAQSGSGGNLQLFVGDRLILSDSAISTSVQGLTTNGGNIFIDPTYVILGNSQIIARAVGGSGGNIDISTQYLLKSADSRIDASSQLGINGNVDILGVNVDLNTDIALLPINFLNAKQWLATPCAARQGNDVSQFTVAGRGGAYRAPADLLASPLALPALPERAADSSSPTRHRKQHETSDLPLLAVSSCLFDATFFAAN